jgi:tetratricopeptide (TPR) repeat protein
VEPRLVLDNCFRRAEQMNPPVREAFLGGGELALEKNDFALAADTFRRGLEKFPDDPDMQSGLARAFKSGNREQMGEYLDLALTTNPRHIPSLLLLADHLVDGERYEEAEKHLATILEVNPNQAEALACRAVMAHLRNDPLRERQFREAALKNFRTNPRVDHLIGLKLSQKYRFAEGAAAQRRSLEFDPAYIPAQRQLAEDLLRLGDHEEGWKLAHAVHQADAYDVTAYNMTTLHDKMLKFRTLTNADFIVKMSEAESQQDIWRKQGKIGHPVDVVGLFGSAEFIIYYGFGVFFTALLDDPRPLLAGIWAVAIMSHVSLLQRVRFAWKRYRFVDPGLRTHDEPDAKAS